MSDEWIKYTVDVPDDRIGRLSLCALCGNSGMVVVASQWGEFEWLVRAFCICPNGRKSKQQHGRRVAETNLTSVVSQRDVRIRK